MDYQRHETTVRVSDFLEKYVKFDTTYACCEACHSFRTRWSCPPYDFDPVEDIWKQYEFLTIICLQIFRLDWDVDRVTAFHRAAQALDEETAALEAARPGSMALSAGSCWLCETCTRPEGLPCRFPERMRYSIESIGGIVDASVKDLLGIELLWATEDQEPAYYTLTGGLLHN